MNIAPMNIKTSGRLRPVSRAAAAAMLAVLAGRAAASPPPLPSLDGVFPIVSGILPSAGSNGRGVVRTSGGSTGSTVFATVDGNTANIQTDARRMVIDWESFNIGEG
ncbi:MAG: hypothetical protein EBS39_08110, partial [Gammaproteobacteria bacterium]|nr:hypothetical protein [Gammaproteobacteria bacterium]